MGYRAIVVDKQGDNVSTSVRELSESDLPPGDVTIQVEWSSINYKDGLALSPTGRVIRSYPMVPGVERLKKTMSILLSRAIAMPVASATLRLRARYSS